MPFAHAVSREDLRTLYPPPARPSVEKEIGHLDQHCRAFIALATFVVVATTDGHVCDASPKGGPPGFVRVLDDHRLAIPDLSGNNRLDSIENLVQHPEVALLFMIPGLDETLRVNGRATLTTDPDVLDRCHVRDVAPRTAIGVDVATAFLHCAKALRRGSVWAPEEWPDRSALPSVACMLRDHYGLPELDVEAVQRRLDESYETRMWAAGGQPTA